MRRTVVAIASLAAVGICGPTAFAADMPIVTKAPVAVAAYNWTGWYVGVNAGGTWGSADTPTTTVFAGPGYFASTSVASINATNQSSDFSGFTGGIQAGYNWQFNPNLVAGIEVDFNYFGNRGSNTVTNVYPCCAPTSYTINAEVKTDWLFTARPRIGWAINNWLLYLTGGVALTNLKGDFVFTDTFAAALETGSVSKTKFGWVIGFGAEYAMLNRWSLKAEYLYVDFGQISTTSTNLTAFVPRTPFPASVFTHSVDLQSHIVRLGLNYKL